MFRTNCFVLKRNSSHCVDSVTYKWRARACTARERTRFGLLKEWDDWSKESWSCFKIGFYAKYEHGFFHCESFIRTNKSICICHTDSKMFKLKYSDTLFLSVSYTSWIMLAILWIYVLLNRIEQEFGMCLKCPNIAITTAAPTALKR